MQVKNYINRPEIRKQLKEKSRIDRITNPEKYLWLHAKKRAKKYKLAFSIQIEDIKIPNICPVLGVELKHGIKVVHDFSPTLDRIIPALGYVPSNIIVMSKKANTIKSNGTLEEHKKLVEWMENYNEKIPKISK